MKTFYGVDYKINQLDKTHIVTIRNNFNDTNTNITTYTPAKDGIFIVGCSYQEGAYAYIVNNSFNVRQVSVAPSKGGSVAQQDGICNAYAGETYTLTSVRGQWFYIPYK